jgi:hypothetical protein
VGGGEAGRRLCRRTQWIFHGRRSSQGSGSNGSPEAPSAPGINCLLWVGSVWAAPSYYGPWPMAVFGFRHSISDIRCNNYITTTASAAACICLCISHLIIPWESAAICRAAGSGSVRSALGAATTTTTTTTTTTLHTTTSCYCYCYYQQWCYYYWYCATYCAT